MLSVFDLCKTIIVTSAKPRKKIPQSICWWPSLNEPGQLSDKTNEIKMNLIRATRKFPPQRKKGKVRKRNKVEKLNWISHSINYQERLHGYFPSTNCHRKFVLWPHELFKTSIGQNTLILSTNFLFQLGQKQNDKTRPKCSENFQ